MATSPTWGDRCSGSIGSRLLLDLCLVGCHTTCRRQGGGVEVGDVGVNGGGDSVGGGSWGGSRGCGYWCGAGKSGGGDWGGIDNWPAPLLLLQFGCLPCHVGELLPTPLAHGRGHDEASDAHNDHEADRNGGGVERAGPFPLWWLHNF